jgi:hypothetical protein
VARHRGWRGYIQAGQSAGTCRHRGCGGFIQPLSPNPSVEPASLSEAGRRAEPVGIGDVDSAIKRRFHRAGPVDIGNGAVSSNRGARIPERGEPQGGTRRHRGCRLHDKRRLDMVGPTDPRETIPRARTR